MPSVDENDTPSVEPASKRPSVSARLAAAESQIEQLKAANDALMNESLNSWLTVVGDESRILGEVYSTLSWRITRPLRLVRQVQRKVAEVGAAETTSLVAARVKQRLGRRA